MDVLVCLSVCQTAAVAKQSGSVDRWEIGKNSSLSNTVDIGVFIEDITYFEWSYETSINYIMEPIKMG